MFRITVVFFVALVVSIIASEDSDSNEIKRFNSENINDLTFISSHNTNEEISHLPFNYGVFDMTEDVEGIVHYSIGARVRNDQLVAQGGQNQSFPQPHNVQIQLTYPSQGYGAAVSYVAIVVNQTSSLGRAYIVKGGINQHVISIIVEAYNTLVFNVYAYVYGV